VILWISSCGWDKQLHELDKADWCIIKETAVSDDCSYCSEHAVYKFVILSPLAPTINAPMLPAGPATFRWPERHYSDARCFIQYLWCFLRREVRVLGRNAPATWRHGRRYTGLAVASGWPCVTLSDLLWLVVVHLMQLTWRQIWFYCGRRRNQQLRDYSITDHRLHHSCRFWCWFAAEVNNNDDDSVYGAVIIAEPLTEFARFTWWMYTVSGKKRVWSISGITSSNTDRFLKFFHCYNLQKICNKGVVKYPTTPQTRHYTTLWNNDVRKLACPALLMSY